MLELGPHATRDAPGTMVCTVDHLASAAGSATMRDGGSAVDAAIAASAVLAVTAPHLCGMGGDLLALVHDGGVAPRCLDATGRAGSLADPERLRAEGHTAMPYRLHPASVTVPGCVDGWLALHERFGVLDLGQVLAPAIRLADAGFPAAPLLVLATHLLHGLDDPSAAELAAQAQRPGATVRRPGVAAALRAIAEHGRAGFYEGDFGVGLLERCSTELVEDDLRRPQARWVEPLRTRVWGHDLWTTPPPSQGYLTLAAAWIAAGLDLPADPDDPRWVHLLVEAAKQAGHDRLVVLHEGADGAELLRAERLGPRRSAIDPDRAAPLVAPAGPGDTIYLCAVDERRQAVSLIQSTAADFGSHLFEPATGVNLHNRGIGFSLEPGHPAELVPGRRPPSTLCPAMVTRSDGSVRAVVGTMGGDTQPQTLLQLVARLLQVGQRPGTCIAAPRAVLTNSGRSFTLWEDPAAVGVAVEGHAPPGWAEGLAALGHAVVRRPAWDHATGHAHLIEVTLDGLSGAADPRAGIGSAHGT